MKNHALVNNMTPNPIANRMKDGRIHVLVCFKISAVVLQTCKLILENQKVLDSTMMATIMYCDASEIMPHLHKFFLYSHPINLEKICFLRKH